MQSFNPIFCRFLWLEFCSWHHLFGCRFLNGCISPRTQLPGSGVRNLCYFGLAPDVFSSALYRFCHNFLVPSVYVFTVICTTVSIGVLTQREVSVFVLLLGLLQLSGSELWSLVFGGLGRGGKLYMSAMTIFFHWERLFFYTRP